MTRRVLDTFTPAAAGVPPGYHVAPLPPELLDWLADLLVLRGVPLSYLVPHPDLLPPESIRFFHVDPNFTAHLIDGALAAADLGATDHAFHRPLALSLREQAEQRLLTRLFPDESAPSAKEQAKGAAPEQLPQLAGFLLRSEIVRRWPGLSVTGWDSTNRSRPPLLLARKDRLAAGLLLVLFAGVPRRVELAEPAEGVRFGAEPSGDGTWSIQRRDPEGALVGGDITVSVAANRRLDLLKLRTDATLTAAPTGGAHLSLCLQQTPYVQVFQGSGAHERGRLRRIGHHLKQKAGG